MSEDLNFHFPFADLLYNGNTILIAGEGDPAVRGRLPDDYVADARALWSDLGGEDALKAQKKGDAGQLTKEEQAKRDVLEPLMQALKDTAKKAFKGSDVKLHDEYQVGINEPHDTATVLRRAGLQLASAKTDAAALKAKGWSDADTAKLEAAIGAFRTTDETHEGAKIAGGDATGQRNHDANVFYEQLQTIQNAASLEYPVTNPANSAKRAGFLLGKFPPHGSGGKDKKKPAQPQPPAPPPA